MDLDWLQQLGLLLMDTKYCDDIVWYVFTNTHYNPIDAYEFLVNLTTKKPLAR